ncbi:MAG: ExbD/TolR family protein [Pseudomonadota bacterium]
MGASVKKPGGGGRRYRPVAEINVTPFVDVMLVLLIVFMVTAPLLTLAVPLDLPRADAQSMPDDNKPLTISIDAEGAVFIEDEEVPMDDLLPKLAEVLKARDGDERIYVRGDEGIDYGRVIEVVSRINRSGFNKVALVTKPVDQSGR